MGGLYFGLRARARASGSPRPALERSSRGGFAPGQSRYGYTLLSGLTHGGVSPLPTAPPLAPERLATAPRPPALPCFPRFPLRGVKFFVFRKFLFFGRSLCLFGGWRFPRGALCLRAARQPTVLAQIVHATMGYASSLPHAGVPVNRPRVRVEG